MQNYNEHYTELVDYQNHLLDLMKSQPDKAESINKILYEINLNIINIIL